jgi:hypothetical protein
MTNITSSLRTVSAAYLLGCKLRSKVNTAAKAVQTGAKYTGGKIADGAALGRDAAKAAAANARDFTKGFTA